MQYSNILEHRNTTKMYWLGLGLGIPKGISMDFINYNKNFPEQYNSLIL